MQSLMFLACFVQKLLKKNFWGWLDPPPLVKEGLKSRGKSYPQISIYMKNIDVFFNNKSQLSDHH